MPFAGAAALPGLNFERERVPPGVLEIARFPHGPQSFGAVEKPFATSAQLRQVVPTRYRIRRSFPVPKHRRKSPGQTAPVDRGSPKSFLRKGPLVFLIFRRGGRANAIQIVSGFQTEARSLLRSDMRAEKYLSSGETRL